MRRWKKRYDWNKKQHQTVEEFLEDGGDIDKLPSKGSPEPRCFTAVRWGQAPIKKQKGKSNYKRYMGSSDWLKDKRREAFSQLGSACEICSSTKNINIHHNNYNRLEGESVWADLLIVCEECHKLFHKKTRGRDMRNADPLKSQSELCTVCCEVAAISYQARYRLINLCECCMGIYEKEIKQELIVERLEQELIVEKFDKPPPNKQESTASSRKHSKPSFRDLPRIKIRKAVRRKK